MPNKPPRTSGEPVISAATVRAIIGRKLMANRVSLEREAASRVLRRRQSDYETALDKTAESFRKELLTRVPVATSPVEVRDIGSRGAAPSSRASGHKV